MDDTAHILQSNDIPAITYFIAASSHYIHPENPKQRQTLRVLFTTSSTHVADHSLLLKYELGE